MTPLSLDYPVVGVRVWQALTPHNIPQYIPMCLRWEWAEYQPDRLYSLLTAPPRIREWTAGVNTAVCGAYNAHAAPQHRCTCGLYAYHGIEDLINVYGVSDDGEVKEPWTLGIVRGWGQIYCHSNGWRAEKAEILALFSDWGRNTRVPLIASYYGVPALTKRALPAIISEFGTPVPKSMRPQANERSNPNSPTS